ncbi:MAG: cell division protein SepF [Candidatus Thermoplasmatota archaeon]|nr:cell division protein SepF [Candidatus Thermoplasmatota archaeon]
MAVHLGRKKQTKNEIRKPGEPRRFIDLNDLNFSSDASEIKTTVKVAEIYRYEDIFLIREFVNDGSFVIVDCSKIYKEESLFRNVVEELRRLGKDSGGDIARLGESLIIVTPKGVAIDKQKVRGSLI